MNRILFIAVMLLTLALAGCGNKGPLVRPSDIPAESPAESPPAPTTVAPGEAPVEPAPEDTPPPADDGNG